MTRAPRSLARARRTAPLLASCAISLALAAASTYASAQNNGGFQGRHTVPAGQADVFTSENFTEIDVRAPRTVIDWTPTVSPVNGLIDFLPSGTTAAFVSYNQTDYTVLNRILPGSTASIGLNGTITSSVYDGGEGQIAGRGNVWFYTPNGFVVGRDATINVGGLILTTNDIAFTLDQTGNANFLDANGAINFRGAPGSAGSIVNQGTLVGSSYIALVAPRVVQSGMVRSDGSIAYVAAEEVDLTINAGAFDIAIRQGTTDPNGIDHSGTTSGDAAGGSKTISFVAVPKNTALTMLLSGSVGYQSAQSASADGTAIVLSAGDANSPDGNIAIGRGDFSNAFTASATGDITVAPTPLGPNEVGIASTNFASFASLSGDKSVTVRAARGTTISAQQGLSLRSSNAASGGSITVEALAGGLEGGGTIAVNGTLSASADHFGGSRSTDPTTGSNGLGGTVQILADGGTIASSGFEISASGFGGNGSSAGGEGRGGTITMRAGLGGTIEGGYASLRATGDGGPSFSFSSQESLAGGQGGIGRGGSITIADSRGDAQTDPTGGLFALGSLFADASAVGGNSGSFGAGLGGDAFGGTVDLTFDRQDQSLSSLSLTARAADGDAALDPVGGTIDMTVGGGSAVNVDFLSLDTGVFASINGPRGAFGTGGTINLTVEGGAALSTIYSELRSDADVPFIFGTPERTPDLTGGTINVKVDGARFTARDLYVSATAENFGATEGAGFAKGGTISIEASSGGAIATEAVEGIGTFVVTTEASATNGTSVNSATGGAITLAARNGGSLEAVGGTIELYAGAEGRPNFDFQSESQSELYAGNGASALGGTIAIDALSGSIRSGIIADVAASGGAADDNAGSGAAGSVSVRNLAGTLTDGLLVLASGRGGESYVSGDGGDGRGGRLTFSSDKDAIFDAFGLNFSGVGVGGAATDGAGGDGHGGSAQVDILGGKHEWFDANFDGSARGAQSSGTDSTAGSAYGSPDGLLFHLGAEASLSAPSLALDARASAGANGAGNEAVGGIASVLVNGGAGLGVEGVGLNASGSLVFEEVGPTDLLNTPTARGGSVSIVADGGTIATSRLDAIANGQTSGAMLAAGSATGGTAIVGAANNGAIEIIASSEGGGVEIQALGLGGEGPSAAHATGGTATLYTSGGRFESPLGLVVRAGAGAGDFAGSFNSAGIGSNGFDARGGTAAVEMRTGTGDGAIVVPSLVVTARGVADRVSSVEGAGGTGIGGTARLAVASGALDTGTITLAADGRGGVAGEHSGGGAAYTSGAGAGGTAELRMTGGTIDTTGLTLIAEGNGGDGVGGSSGATSSLAGAGAGGTAALTASGGTLTNSGGITFDSRGYGGTGAFNPGTEPGGAGATGTGGTAHVIASPGGSANLGIAGPIVLFADGSGGSSGLSASGVRGEGGDGVGGTAQMALADISFDFGTVALNASGFAGLGPGGDGTGGAAQFALTDTTSAPIGPRKIGALTLQASGSAGTGGTSTGGITAFASQVGNPVSGLAIAGNLRLIANGLIGPAGNGFVGAVSGAPVAVGGTVQIITPRDALLTMGSGGSLQAGGDFSVNVGRIFSSSGPIATAANASVFAPSGISMTHLSAGGTTLLRAPNGPVMVSTDLRSGGLVTVLGRSVDLVSLGSLSFADADATAGDLSIRTAGDLDLVTVDATGAVTLASSGGSIHNTGAVNGVGIAYIAAGHVRSDVALASGAALSVNAGGTFTAPGVTAAGNVSISADLGMALESVVSGSSTLLQANGGAVSVDGLTSPGLVTALARSVSLTSPGALSFASAQATGGNLVLNTAGNLSLGQASASDALALTSGGAVNATGPLAAGGNAAISGANGVALGSFTSGGTSSLTSSSGAVGVANLNSAGAVTARGRSVDIASTGPLSFADLDATAGNAAVQTAGNLTVNTVDATGSVSLVSTGGALQATGAINANGITLGSQASMQLAGPLSTSSAISLASAGGSVSASAPVFAGGPLSVTGQGGVALGAASSGGSTVLSASTGAVTAANLFSSGPVTANGGSVDIASTGALNFADARASAGDLRLTTAGNLTLAQATASGAALFTSSTGAVAATGPVTVGGPLTASGSAGVAFGTLMSGGTTALTSTNGAAGVANLASAGAVTAAGRTVDLRGNGSMMVTSAQASNGALSLQAGQNLTVGTASATGSANLVAGGDVQTTGPITAAGLALAGGNVTADGPLQSSAALAIDARQVLEVNALASGNTVTIAASDMVIGSGGRIGQRGITKSVAITSQDGAKPMNLGGAGKAGEFSLDKAEASRLFADDQIVITQRSGSSAPGEFRIGELAMGFGAATASGANIGVGGLLKVDALGRVEVNGAVSLTTVSAGDRFSIDPTRIDVIAGEGSIAMRNASGAILGTLELQAGTIAVADRATLSAIGSAGDFGTISRLLDTPAAGPSGGTLQAGTINLIVGDALFIQNTGTSTAYDARRGFNANAIVITTASATPQIAINGLVATPSDTLTGVRTAQAVTINGAPATQLAQGLNVTINGCAAGVRCDIESFVSGGRTEDELERPLAPANPGEDGATGEMIQVEDNEPLITPPLVDEPITGVGNDDLWQPRCDPDGDGKACSAEETTE